MGGGLLGSFHHPVYRVHSQTKAESFLYKGSRGEGRAPTKISSIFCLYSVDGKMLAGVEFSRFQKYLFTGLKTVFN